MTKVFQIFGEEKQEAVIEAVNKKNEDFTEMLLADGDEIAQIMKYTGLTGKQIEDIRDRLSITK